MKTAIYIEDGIVQLVLTPENEFERNTLRSFEDKEIRMLKAGFVDVDVYGWQIIYNNQSRRLTERMQSMEKVEYVEERYWTWTCPHCGYLNEEFEYPGDKDILICGPCTSEFEPEED